MTDSTLTLEKLEAMMNPPPAYRVLVVASWVREWQFFGPPLRVPSKAQGRRQTKRAWKRRNRWQRRGWSYVTVEPPGPLALRDASGLVTYLLTPTMHAKVTSMLAERRMASPAFALWPDEGFAYKPGPVIWPRFFGMAMLKRSPFITDVF